MALLLDLGEQLLLIELDLLAVDVDEHLLTVEQRGLGEGRVHDFAHDDLLELLALDGGFQGNVDAAELMDAALGPGLDGCTLELLQLLQAAVGLDGLLHEGTHFVRGPGLRGQRQRDRHRRVQNFPHRTPLGIGNGRLADRCHSIPRNAAVLSWSLRPVLL